MNSTEEKIKQIKEDLHKLLTTEFKQQPIDAKAIKNQLTTYLTSKLQGRRKVGFSFDAKMEGDTIILTPLNLLSGLILNGYLPYELPQEIMDKPYGTFKTDRGTFSCDLNGFSFTPIPITISFNFNIDPDGTSEEERH